MKTVHQLLVVITILLTNKGNFAYSQNFELMGGGPALLGALGASVGLALLSNEVEISPVISFYGSGRYVQNDTIHWEGVYPISTETHTKNAIYPGLGISIIFKKIFKHGELDFGGKLLPYKIVHDKWGDDPQFFTGGMLNKPPIPTTPFHDHEEISHFTWNMQLDYLQYILFNKLFDNIILFVGPAITLGYYRDLNEYRLKGEEFHHSSFGFGGIAGVKYKITPRFGLDLRYELTTRSHLLQFGISYLYHKNKKSRQTIDHSSKLSLKS